MQVQTREFVIRLFISYCRYSFLAMFIRAGYVLSYHLLTLQLPQKFNYSIVVRDDNYTSKTANIGDTIFDRKRR